MSSYNESLVRQIAEREVERQIDNLLDRRVRCATPETLDDFTRTRVKRLMRRRLQHRINALLDEVVRNVLVQTVGG